MRNPLTYIEDIFLWSSGAHVETIKKVPEEKSKYFGIGGTIIFTGLMATLAGGYAFYTAFKDETLSVLFGIFWGALIFNLDRYIVATFGVGDGKKTISKQELIEGAPRIIMAILLGIVISTPLELKIFEREINSYIGSLQNEKVTIEMERDSILSNYKKELTLNKNEIEETSSKINLINSGQTVYLNDSEINRINNEIKQKEIEKHRLQQIYNQKKNTYLNTWHKYRQEYINIHKNDTVIENDLIKYCNSKSSPLWSEKEKAKKNLNQIINLITNLNSKLSNLRDNNKKDKNADINKLKQDLSQLEQKKLDLENKIKTRINNITTRFGSYDGFSAKLEAFGLLKEDKPIVQIASVFIMLLFIFIEIAPVMFKMMTERGAYDDLMDQKKYEYSVQEKLRKSKINSKINTELALISQKNDQKLQAELLANDKLLTDIAKAQAEIAAVAIESWKKEMLKKVKAEPSIIIKSSTKRNKKPTSKTK